MLSASTSGTISLVIGVTGHRDLFPEDYASLEVRIKEILTAEQRKFPSTPLLLLSALAEGADRVAARAARDLNIPYIAVLPMERDLYQIEFTTGESGDEFDSLLAGAAQTIILPLESATANDLSSFGPARDRQYEALAAFLVNTSQILIAVWDQNRAAEKCGGTTDVVLRMLGEKEQPGISAVATGGPVHLLLARRISTGGRLPTGPLHEIRYPNGASRDDFEGMFKLIDQYNCDVRAGYAKPEAVARGQESLCGVNVALNGTTALDWITGVYAYSDALALHFAAKNLRIWNTVFALLAIAGVALAWLNVHTENWPALAAYYACLLAAFVFARWEIRVKRRARHEDYRALAETLRVQFFWLIAGISAMASDSFMRKQPAEFRWIWGALGECRLHQMADSLAAGIREEPARLPLLRAWMSGQRDYFKRKYVQYQHRDRTLNRIAFGFGVVGLITPFIGTLAVYFTHSGTAPFTVACYAIASIAMIWASLIWNYSQLRGFQQEARQYARMHELFSISEHRLIELERIATETSYATAEQNVLELGLAALADNSEWLSMHRRRKLTPAIAP